MIVPVICENVKTGSIGRYVHALDTQARKTLCGIDPYDLPRPVQLSVEPDGTKVTCFRCQSGSEEAA